MREGVLFGHAAGGLADHYPQRRARLQALASGGDHGLAVDGAGVRRLDEQHRFLRRLLVRRLVEFVQSAVQQALVVQGDAEQGTGGDVAGGAAHV
ncbi:Uncharacterised protein [Mycobacterium tuberculosis]|nr:Uncharacterised protein [Mycobacterium tuberculosis]